MGAYLASERPPYPSLCRALLPRADRRVGAVRHGARAWVLGDPRAGRRDRARLEGCRAPRDRARAAARGPGPDRPAQPVARVAARAPGRDPRGFIAREA